jgi:hypothetical protein
LPDRLQPEPLTNNRLPVLNSSALSALGTAKQNGAQWFSIGGAIVPDPAASFTFLFGFTGSVAATLSFTYPKLCKVYP